MSDLLLHVADGDAEAFMKGLLSRHDSLNIKNIRVSIRRNPNRDSGVFQNAHELCRLESRTHEKIMVLFDYHGCGRDNWKPQEVCDDLQKRLNSCGMENSTVILLVPELERWLWHTPQAIARHYGVDQSLIFKGQTIFQNQKKQNSMLSLHEDMPKELFEYVVTKYINKSISFSDFEGIAKKSDIGCLKKCAYFSRMLDALQRWFPATESV